MQLCIIENLFATQEISKFWRRGLCILVYTCLCAHSMQDCQVMKRRMPFLTGAFLIQDRKQSIYVTLCDSEPGVPSDSRQGGRSSSKYMETVVCVAESQELYQSVLRFFSRHATCLVLPLAIEVLSAWCIWSWRASSFFQFRHKSDIHSLAMTNIRCFRLFGAHTQGRGKSWQIRQAPLLKGARKEWKAVASSRFCQEMSQLSQWSWFQSLFHDFHAARPWILEGPRLSC